MGKPDLAPDTPPTLIHYQDIVGAWTPEELKIREKRFLRKIDFRLLPILCFMYIMNYIDRYALPHARVQGIEKDLNLTGYEYNIVLSVTFVGYISMQVPSNLLLSLLRPSWYLGSCMAAWGLVSGLSGVVQNYHGLLLCRFFLGITEAPFFVGCTFLFSSWYTRKEIGLRLGILFAAGMLSGAFGGLFAAGIGAAFKNNKIESWRWLFIIEGSITVVFAVVTGLVIPDWPTTTKWLTTEEQALAVTRLLRDNRSEEEDISIWGALKLTAADYRVWLCVLCQVCIQAVASVSNFLPTLVGNFGYGTIETLLLTAPPYILTAILCVANSWISDRLSVRSPFIVGPCLITIAGIIINLVTTNMAAQYFSIFLTLSSSYACFQISNAWMANIASRPRKKRAVALALNTAMGNSAMTWTPYLYPESQGPRYITAWSVNLAVTTICVVITIVLRWRLSAENRDLGQAEFEFSEGIDFINKGNGTVEQQEHSRPNLTEIPRREAYRFQI